MTTATSYETPDATPMRRSWLGQAEDWLDSRGKGAWIALMVLGFIFCWPVGLALLFYMIWSKKMMRSCSRRGGFRDHMAEHMANRRAGFSAMRPSGNRAFDAYKEETLRRLEEEQDSFQSFLDRLRMAKDQAEFDQFMEERSRKAAEEREASAGSGSDA